MLETLIVVLVGHARVWHVSERLDADPKADSSILLLYVLALLFKDSGVLDDVIKTKLALIGYLLKRNLSFGCVLIRYGGYIAITVFLNDLSHF